MEAKQLEQYRRYLRNNSLPSLFGPLQLSLVSKLAQDGSPGAIRLLAETVLNNRNDKVRQAALECLRKINSQDSIDQVCRVWYESRHPTLAELMLVYGWVAYSWTIPQENGRGFYERVRDPSATPFEIRVWSALKTGRLDLLVDQESGVVEFLLKACQDEEQDIAQRAKTVLGQLTEPATQDYLCRMVMENKNPIVREIVLAANYAPSQGSERALFFFLTEQWERYENLDFDLRLLHPAYLRASEYVRQQLIALARQTGRVELLTLISSGRGGARPGLMSRAEWELTIDLLKRTQQWAVLWDLALKVPARWAIQILQCLAKTDWLPVTAQERTSFEELKKLAQNCNPSQLPLGKLLSRFLHPTIPHIAAGRASYLSPDGQRLIKWLAAGEISILQLESFPPANSADPVKPGASSSEFSYSLKLELKLILDVGQDSRKQYHNLDLLAFSRTKRILGFVESWQIDELGWERVSHLLNLQTGQHRTLPVVKTEAGLHKLGFSQDNPILISGRGVLYLWEEDRWRKLELALPAQVRFGNFEISPDGRVVAGLKQNEVSGVWCWQLSDGKVVKQFNFNKFQISSFAFSPDGQILAAALAPKNLKHPSKGLTHPIWLWNLANGKVIKKLPGHKGLVNRLVFSPDGQLLASLSQYRTFKLWNLVDDKLIMRKVTPNHHILDLTFNSDGQNIISLERREELLHNQSLETPSLYTRVSTLFVNSWASRLTHLSRLPIEQITPNDYNWIQKKIRQDSNLSYQERHWLKFIQALISYRWQSEIELDEPTKLTPADYDIELEDF